MKLFYCLVVYNFINTLYSLIKKFWDLMSRKIKYCVEIVRNDFNKSKYSIIYRINLIMITNTIIKYINFDKKGLIIKLTIQK